MAQLRPGRPIDVRVVNGVVELEPADARVIIQERNGIWLAVPAKRKPPLTQAVVDATVDALRTRQRDR